MDKSRLARSFNGAGEGFIVLHVSADYCLASILYGAALPAVCWLDSFQRLPQNYSTSSLKHFSSFLLGHAISEEMMLFERPRRAFPDTLLATLQRMFLNRLKGHSVGYRRLFPARSWPWSLTTADKAWGSRTKRSRVTIQGYVSLLVSP